MTTEHLVPEPANLKAGSEVDISLYGPVALSIGSEPVTLGGPKPRMALVRLALSPGNVVAAETLIDLLWGETPPPTARRSLQAHVAKLRSALGGAAGPLRPESPGYVLAVPKQSVDAFRLEANLQKARALVDVDARRAQALLQECRRITVDQPLADLAHFETLTPQVQWLSRLARELHELDVDLSLANGDFQDAIGQLERFVEDDAGHEPYWARLMLAYYRSGRQADALATYQRARQSLLDQFGLEPSSELRAMESSILRQDTDLQANASTSRCPFKGLLSYQVDDGEAFFGRSELTDRLLRTVVDNPITVVVGPSGVGKSSLLRAGLAHRISSGSAPPHREAAVLTPGLRPLRSLHRTSDTADVIIVDQFEEIFTPVGGPGEADTFVAELLDIAVSERARVVIAVRADFYNRCVVVPELAPYLSQAQIIVPPMNESETREMLRETAARGGLTVETALTDLVAEEASGEPGALPLLSHALVETWRRRDGDTLTADAYVRAGSIAGAIAETAERLYNGSSTGSKEAMERLFLRLVQPGEGSSHARRTIERNELAGVEVDDQLIDQLIEERLLTARSDQLEIAHEALIVAWPRLGEWIENDSDGARMHRHLSESALSWQELERDESELYQGMRLANTANWAEAHSTLLSDLEREFLTASEEAAESELRRQVRTNRKLKRFAGAAALAVVVAGTAAFVAVRQAQSANEQREEVEVTRAVELARSDPDISGPERLRLAVELYDRASTPATRGLLLESLLTGLTAIPTSASKTLVVDDAPPSLTGGALLSSDQNARPEIRRAEDLQVAVRNLDFSPVAVTQSAGRYLGVHPETFAVVDLETSEVLGAPDRQVAQEQPNLTHVAISTDGSTVAIASDATGEQSAALHLLDVASGQLSLIRTANERVDAVMLDVAGDHVAAITDDRSASVWGVATGELLIQTPPSPNSSVSTTTIAISPDGEQVALGRSDGGVEIWRRGDDEWLGQQLTSPHATKVSWIGFDEVGVRLASTSRDGVVTVWRDPANSSRGQTLQLESSGTLRVLFEGESGSVTALDGAGRTWGWTPGQTRGLALPTAGSTQGAIYDDFALAAVDDAVVRVGPSFEPESIANHPGVVRVFTSPRVADYVAFYPGRAEWYSTGDRRATVPIEDVKTATAAFSGDGKRVAIYDGADNVTVLGDDGRADESVNVKTESDGPAVQAVGLNQDGSELVVSTSVGRLQWYEIDGIEAEILLPESQGFDGQFVGDGTVAGIGSGGVQIVDPRSGEVSALGFGSGATRFAVHGSTVATLDVAGSVSLWDRDSGALGETPIAIADTTGDLSFSTDGSRLVMFESGAALWLETSADAWVSEACSRLESHSELALEGLTELTEANLPEVCR